MEKAGFKNFKIGWATLILALALFGSQKGVCAQETVDRIVATVGDGFSRPELITYSDLMWQLALESETPLDPPNKDDLNRALQLLINFRLFALEAKRLPSAEPNEDEIKAQIRRILSNFSTESEFQRRLRFVGFDSASDYNFERMMRERVAIEKYIDFRFRSFVIITPEEEKRYYRDIFAPDFRQKNPGLLLPSLEETRAQINRTLTERKIGEDIETFLDNSKRRAEIVILHEFN